jgi:hypothetical protein
MPGGLIDNTPAPDGRKPDDDDWMEDREVFSREQVDKDDRSKGFRLVVTKESREQWDPRNPRRFLPDVALEILQNLAVGATKDDAADAAGILGGRSTLHNWKKQSNDPERSTPELRAFFVLTERAKAQRRIEALARIRKAASDGNWTAAAWFLERSDPENWRQRNSVIPENADGTPIQPPAVQIQFVDGPGDNPHASPVAPGQPEAPTGDPGPPTK